MKHQLLLSGWNDKEAKNFVAQVLERYPEVRWDELWLLPDLAGIILDHNHDPHDTDLVGTVIAIARYIRDKVL